MGSTSLLNESNFKADTEAVLEEERATEALHRALAHNADTVTEHISFVHIMSSQNDYSVFLVGLEHFP